VHSQTQLLFVIKTSFFGFNSTRLFVVKNERKKKFGSTINRSYLYSSPIIVPVIKSRIIRWTGHVVRMGKRRGVYKVLVGNLVEKEYLGDPGVDERIILRWLFRKWDVGWLRIGTVGVHL
jgi:hypothetical protein